MLGILLGLITLMVLAYLGWSIIWVAPVAAGIVALTGGLNLLDAYTGTYMSGFVDFAQSWFPVFMLGAVFGKLMEDTGMARSVAVALTKLIGHESCDFRRPGGFGSTYIRRCQSVRCYFRCIPACSFFIPRSRYQPPAVAADCGFRGVYVYNDGTAGNAADSKPDPYRVFSYKCHSRAVNGHHCGTGDGGGGLSLFAVA